MRLAYWLRYYPTASETFVYREAAALKARGVQVQALAIGAREEGGVKAPWDCVYPPRRALRGLSQLKDPTTREAIGWLSQHQRPKDCARALWALETLSGVDGIHCHFAGEAAEWAWVAHKVLGLPYVLTVHAVDLFKPRPSLDTLLRDAAAVLTVTHHNAERILQRSGVRPQVQPCGVEPEFWAGPGPQAGGPLLFVGRDVPKKGLGTLLSALGGLPDVELDIVGVTSLAPQRAGVRSHGACSAVEIRSLMHRAAAFVLPCQVAPDGDRDGLPVALMEAMAAGLPVITTDLPGLEDLVDEEVGWVVPQGSVVHLRDTLQAALRSQHALHQRGQAARERVKAGFTLAAQADGVLDVWAGVGLRPACGSPPGVV
ncbi:MAG: glycosyltransferase family 4 protein [Myxococcota bacterium]|nr:glycosyltransferase family 4 protein [Myxococcota bacterium]